VRYFTIKETGESLFKEKGSRFIGLTFSVESIGDIQECLGEVRKKYHDARHHCYAYILGMTQQNFRSNDDGEPNHSAGDPILGQIRSKELTNTLVIVVRYFGGTKLGVGGLISAYKQAAQDALEKSGRIEIFPWTYFKIIFGYPATSSVEKIITDFKVDVLERDFTEKCVFHCRIVEDRFALFLKTCEDSSIEIVSKED